MNKISALLASLLLALGAAAHAQTPKEQYNADSKRAATRYADDKKICAGEGESSARMQCARDAKSEYDKAMDKAHAELKAATPATAQHKDGGACIDCGKVTSVTVGEKAGEGSAVGVIAGGVAGALLGHQVGGGTGKDLATVAGAAGGAYAGHKAEQKLTAKKVWTVHVSYDNGKKASFAFDHDPMMVAGDKVKNSGNSIARH
ncbi:MAG: glycine zipper 2TM domain-containing protein [Pseudomonadota bacterium]